MPVVTLDRKVFDRLVGKKLPVAELKEKIALLGTDLESISDTAIVVEVFPNRPDMLSEQGFARAFSSFIGVRTGLRQYLVRDSHQKITVKNALPEWPYVVTAIVKGLSLTEEKITEIIQIQEKLGVTHLRNRQKGGLGLYPLQKITFPITFTSEVPEKIVFQPLESSAKMNGLQILERHPTGRKYAHLCRGWKRFPVFTDATGKILSMPPIINSHDLGKIDAQTTEVFVEATGTDLPTLHQALNILVTTLADMGGKPYSLKVVYSDQTITTPDLQPQKMKCPLAYVNRVLGVELTESQLKKYLEKMGHDYHNKTIQVPAYRADVLHPIDIVEDVAIAYGYQNFVPELPNVFTVASEDPQEQFCSKLREMCSGLGLLEVKNYHLLDRDSLTAKMQATETPIPLQNALGDHNHLRNWLLPGLLKVLTENQHHEYPQNIFEIGTIFSSAPALETGVQESNHWAVAICHDQADFTQMKQIVESVFRLLGKEIVIKETVHPSFLPGRVGNILLQGKSIGIIGEIHPQVLSNWNLAVPVVGMEVDVELLIQK